MVSEDKDNLKKSPGVYFLRHNPWVIDEREIDNMYIAHDEPMVIYGIPDTNKNKKKRWCCCK